MEDNSQQNLCQKWLVEGQQRYTMSDFSGAATAFRKATEADQKNKSAWYNLGSTLWKLEEPEPALKAFVLALNEDPNFEMAKMQAMNLEFESECKNEDLNMFLTPRECLEFARKAHEDYEGGAGIELDCEIAYCNKAVELDPMRVEAWYRRGLALKEKDIVYQAILDFTRVLELDANHGEAMTQLKATFEPNVVYNTIGPYADRLCRPARAEQAISHPEAIESRSEDLEVLRESKTLVKNKTTTTAVHGEPSTNSGERVHSETVTSRHPSEEPSKIRQESSAGASASQNCIATLRSTPKTKQELRFLQGPWRYIRRELAFAKARSHLRRREFKDALEHYEDSLKMDPWYRPALTNKASALQQLGRMEDAYDVLTHAFGFGICSSELLLLLVRAYQEKGRPQDAVESIDYAVELYPQSAPAWAERGRLNRSIGKLEEAIADFERSTELDPSAGSTWHGKAITELKCGRKMDAKRSAERAISLGVSKANDTLKKCR